MQKSTRRRRYSLGYSNFGRLHDHIEGMRTALCDSSHFATYGHPLDSMVVAFTQQNSGT